MLTKRLSTFAVTAALTAGLCGSASAAALLSHVVPAAVAGHSAALAGHVDPSTPLRMQVVLPMRHLDKLRILLDQLYNPQSPTFRHWLSVGEFTKQFGPTQKDYDAAIKYFQGQGLAVTHTYANRYMFQAEGKASDVERVLNVTLNTYRHPSQDRTFMAPDREPQLSLNVPVLSITGLDTFILPQPKYHEPDSSRGSRAGTGSGPGGQYIGSDFRVAYYGTGNKAKLNGTGQSVGLMELEGYIPSDVPLYFTTVGQTLTAQVNGISVDGTAVNCGSCNDAEQVLDIDYAISMAPGITQVQVYVGGDPVGVEERMASDNTSKQLSTSWGYSEHFSVEDPLYQEMAVQGQSYMTASGDDSTLQASGPWPEEDANIIAVGGTDLVTASPAGPWQSEPGWEDSAAGPSLDHNILIEPYQLPYINNKNKGSTQYRNVADISANADFDMYVCHNGHCSGGWAGTSFSSPIWAGFTALANQQSMKKHHTTIGFFNPTLYGALKNNKKILHDVVGNSSGVFPAVKGYDLVGGLGSPNGAKTLAVLVGGN
jgi:subtilase family serine protease